MFAGTFCFILYYLVMCFCILVHDYTLPFIGSPCYNVSYYTTLLYIYTPTISYTVQYPNNTCGQVIGWYINLDRWVNTYMYLCLDCNILISKHILSSDIITWLLQHQIYFHKIWKARVWFNVIGLYVRLTSWCIRPLDHLNRPIILAEPAYYNLATW